MSWWEINYHFQGELVRYHLCSGQQVDRWKKVNYYFPANVLFIGSQGGVCRKTRRWKWMSEGSHIVALVGDPTSCVCWAAQQWDEPFLLLSSLLQQRDAVLGGGVLRSPLPQSRLQGRTDTSWHTLTVPDQGSFTCAFNAATKLGKTYIFLVYFVCKTLCKLFLK